MMNDSTILTITSRKRSSRLSSGSLSRDVHPQGMCQRRQSIPAQTQERVTTASNEKLMKTTTRTRMRNFLRVRPRGRHRENGRHLRRLKTTMAFRQRHPAIRPQRHREVVHKRYIAAIVAILPWRPMESAPPAIINIVQIVGRDDVADKTSSLLLWVWWSL